MQPACFPLNEASLADTPQHSLDLSYIGIFDTTTEFPPAKQSTYLLFQQTPNENEKNIEESELPKFFPTARGPDFCPIRSMGTANN